MLSDKKEEVGLRMMLNRRSLNLLQEILTVLMCLRMMLNRRPLNRCLLSNNLNQLFENDVKS